MTTTSFVAAIRFPARHIVLQGESRNVYREQQQFFSKDFTAQLIQWFHDGNNNKTKKVGHRVPDKDRAQSLINLGYEQRPSDLTDDGCREVLKNFAATHEFFLHLYTYYTTTQ